MTPRRLCSSDLVQFEAGAVVEGELTALTLERLLAAVDALVLCQMRLLLEALLTHLTHERTLVGVHARVVLERVGRRELLSRQSRRR